MNYSSNFPPIITKENQCASEFELEERRSFSTKINVYMHNFTMILTFLMTYLAVRKMLAKNIFSITTRNLLFYCMIYYVAHDLYFGYTINRSFYRSITNINDGCKIMFHGSECFFLYLIGVFMRVLLLNSQCAITVERLIVTILPNSDLINSGTMNIMSLLMSVITTSYIKPMGPSEYNSPNCFQQMFVGMATLRSLIWIMVVFDMFCFPVNFVIMMGSRRKFLSFQNSHEYNLKSRYVNKKHMYAAIIVSFISFIQTLLYTVYIAALYFTLEIYSTEDQLFYGNNLALWFYTFPLAGLALPLSIIICYIALEVKKNNKVGVMKIDNYISQEAYFNSLTTQWNRSPSRMSITGL